MFPTKGLNGRTLYSIGLMVLIVLVGSATRFSISFGPTALSDDQSAHPWGVAAIETQTSVPSEMALFLALIVDSNGVATGTPTNVAATSTPIGTPTNVPTDTPSPTPDAAPVLVGAGDITDCTGGGDEATANLLDSIPGTVFTLGDNAYPDGLPASFANCYDPSWGRHKARTRPSAGNDDYNTPGAAGYFGYFGVAAGDPSKGYYSYDLSAWHIVVLNSQIPAGAGSPQEQWLRADLAARPVACTAAYWHKPRFSSGPHGSDSAFTALWQALYEYSADVVLVGHDHDYERFAPQDPNGAADPLRGIREFVVGTGGHSHYTFHSPAANSEVRNSDTFGVLKLTLHPTSYDWQFIPEAGKMFTDSGSASCRLPSTPSPTGLLGRTPTPPRQR